MINSLPSLIRISKVLVYLKVPKHFLCTKWMTAKMHHKMVWYKLSNLQINQNQTVVDQILKICSGKLYYILYSMIIL